MQIGNLKIENNLILAPMAGITNLPFRLIVKDEGCGLVVSEMVSAIALVRNGKKTRDLLNSDPYERPLAVQLFGSEPQIMAEAARIVEGLGVDILDINMGCPAKKVASTGSGSALLKDPLRIKAVIKAVRAAVTIPFTVKIRSGWDSKSTNYLEIGRIAEECGVDAITLHPRTAAQGFGGRSDWSHIAELKKALKIPVIGNGDIKTPEDARKMLDETRCDGIMIGRGALGNPWIFSRTLKYMEEGVLQKPPTEKEIHLTIKRHIEMLADYIGEKCAVREFRKHISWYTKGLFHSADFRKSAIHIDNIDTLMDETEAYFETLESIDDDFFFQAFGKKSVKINNRAHEDIGAASLESAISNKDIDVIIIDAIGKMEAVSQRFKDAVLAALNSPKIVVATIQHEGNGYIFQIKNREDVNLIEVTEKNRNKLIEKIIPMIS